MTSQYRYLPSRAAKAVSRTLSGVILLAVAALIGGFVWFVATLPEAAGAPSRSADGIVVLTGDASRVPDAIELLANGHGKRLLITGVYKATSQATISRLNPKYADLLSCCVDLDHSALNTLGNAVQTRRWVREQGFHSIIVVTSSYHMPRAMVEIARQLPDVVLVPYAVAAERLENAPWWESADTARLLLTEYVKYLFAVLRASFDAQVSYNERPSRAISDALQRPISATI